MSRKKHSRGVDARTVDQNLRFELRANKVGGKSFWTQISKALSSFSLFLSSASAFFPPLSISRQPPLYERMEQAMIIRAILINIKYTGLKILLLEIIRRDIAKKIKKARKQQMFNILLFNIF